MPRAHRYDPMTWFYVSSAEDFGFCPSNGTRVALPPRPWTGQWPRWTGTGWELIPDYRERKPPQFAPEDAQAPTLYWLPGDGPDTPGRQMFTPGDLPDGATLELPEGAAAQGLEEGRQAKVREIDAAYEAAFAATMTMPQADAPTGPDVTAGTALFAVDDPEGLTYVVAQLNATRKDLLDQVAAAETEEAVAAIVVRYVV